MKKVLLFYFKVCLMAFTAAAQTNPNRNKPFTWDNATVYFVVTDRFNTTPFTGESSTLQIQEGLK